MLKPRVTVISSSVGGGVTGSAHIYPVRSPKIRQTYDAGFITQLFNQGNQNAFEEAISNSYFIDFANYQNQAALLSSIDLLNSNFPNQTLKNKTIPICRFDSPTFFNKEHTIINNIVKVMQPHHQHRYPDSGLHYGNYHTLNFFTGSGTRDDACLIYANPITGSTNNLIYNPDSAFTLDFWINPRYDNQTAGAEYHAGTIFHMSSSIALSLVRGSQTDEFGKVSSFKLLLQLSQSADFNPRTIDLNNPNNGGVYPRDLIFTSSHELKKNHWHKISVRWGSEQVNNYSGSIFIDDRETSFYIPSGSLFTVTPAVAYKAQIGGVVIGNFFDSNASDLRRLFGTGGVRADQNPARQNGTLIIGQDWTGPPSGKSEQDMFTNKLNAEIHDIKLFNKYLNNAEVEYLRYNGISDQPILNENGENVSGETPLYDDLLFYVPVFFFPYQSRARRVPLIGIRNTSDQSLTSNNNQNYGHDPDFGFNGYDRGSQLLENRTFHPFNVDISCRQGLLDVNLENFVIEFVQFSKLSDKPYSSISDTYGTTGYSDFQGRPHPRLQSLSSSIIEADTSGLEAILSSHASDFNIAGRLALNTINYSNEFIRGRNLSILPNDNGQFSPNYFPIVQCMNNLPGSTSVTQELTDDFKSARKFYLTRRYYHEKLEAPESFQNLQEYSNAANFEKIDLSNMIYRNYNLNPTSPTTSNNLLYETQDSGTGRTGGIHYPFELSLELPDGYSNLIDEGQNERMTAVNSGFDGSLFFDGVAVSPDSLSSMTSTTSNNTQYMTQRYAVSSRLRTTYSNQMAVFDIPSLYYGNSIEPFSFEIYDNDLMGSKGLVKLKLKDNGNGSLYRADCLTKQATWNNVGDIYYDEGLVLVKSPHLSHFCKKRTEISLTGEQNLHTLIMNIPVEAGLVNSSSNATFKSMPPSENINDADKETVYITGVNIHDNNFNIIMKAQFAQPIIKADDDEFIIRLKQDF